MKEKEHTLKYNILSLDGGGSWAVLQLYVLKEKYGNIKGHEVLKKFDLITASSGGSIVLACLVENWTLDLAISFFESEEKRKSIFFVNDFKNTFFPVYITRFFQLGPKYSTVKKKFFLKSIFTNGDALFLKDIPHFVGKDSLKIIIPTFDALINRARFFKSYESEQEHYNKIKFIEAVHASSNAPLQYFDFPASVKDRNKNLSFELWDGALGGFNNPVLLGLMEAFRLGVAVENIQVISIGTATQTTSYEDKKEFDRIKAITKKYKKKKWQFWSYKYQWRFFTKVALNQAQTIIFNPPDWANYVTLMFLKTKNPTDFSKQFIRLSPMIHINSKTPKEDKKVLEQLYQLDMDLREKWEMDLLKKCFEMWKTGKILNQPITYAIDENHDLIELMGDSNFSEAMKKWE